jgi:hypothetical protein
MDRRYFFTLFQGAPALAFLQKLRPEPPSTAAQGPAHECVDRPNLPCPACLKWTGDPLAIKSNPPDIFGKGRGKRQQ